MRYFFDKNQILDAGSDLQTFPNKKLDAASSAAGTDPLQSFLAHVDSFGIQTQNNFEVKFGAIEGLNFFIQSINLPGSKQNTTEVFYDGVAITIPVNYEPEHDFQMVVINDARGFIYSVLRGYMSMTSLNHWTDPKVDMYVKVLTGQTEVAGYQPYPGAIFACYGVRLTSIGGLDFSRDGNNVQTFSVSGKMIDHMYWPNGKTSEKAVQPNASSQTAADKTAEQKAKKKAAAKKTSKVKKASFESRF